MTDKWSHEWMAEMAAKAEGLGFDAFCTECESATYLQQGRCGCGSGRVVTSLSLSGLIKTVPSPSPHPL